MSIFETDLLSDLIQRKRSCLAQLRGMGDKQFELARSGAITQLLELLAAKQHVLVRLQEVERQLDRFRGEDPERRQWRSPQKREQCAADQAECERLLAEIVIQEKRSEQELIRRRDEAAAQLSGAAWADQARGAYLAQPSGGPAQLDLVSEG
jgi:hypothetical protein